MSDEEFGLMDIEGIPHITSQSSFHRAKDDAPDALAGSKSRAVVFTSDHGESMPHSAAALDFMSVGHFERAIEQAFDDGDGISWAAAMCLAGYPGRARATLEALITVAVSRVANDADNPLSPKTTKNAANTSNSAVEGSDCVDPSISLRGTGVLYTKVDELIDRSRITCWYYVCLCLDPAYDLPERAVVREYLRLSHPKAVSDLRAATTSNQRRQVADSLISRQLPSLQLSFAKIIVGWQLSQFRRVIQLTGVYMGSGGDTSGPADALVRFIRIMCNARIGSFAVVSEDAQFLTRKGTTAFVRAVGSCLQAVVSQRQDLLKPLVLLDAADAKYCYFIAFHLQSLAFVLRGNFAEAHASFDAVASHAPRNAYWVGQHVDLETAASIATNDTRRLQSNLCTRTGQVHVWLSRYYGFADVAERADDIIKLCLFEVPREHGSKNHKADEQRAARLAVEAEMAESMAAADRAQAAKPTKEVHTAVMVDASPRSDVDDMQMAAVGIEYVDVRLQVAVQVVRAVAAFKSQRVVDAWDAINQAALASEDILGTFDLCCSSASPLRIHNSLINIGLLLISSGECPHRNAEVLDRVRDAQQVLRETWPEHVLTFVSHGCIFLGQSDLTEATTVARNAVGRFPDSIYANGLLTAAYARDSCENHAIDVARDVAEKFPHCPSARLIFKAACKENFPLWYRYRGLLRIPLVDGQQLRHGLRSFIIMTLVILHLLLFAALLGINAFIYFTDSTVPSFLSDATATSVWADLTLKYRDWPAMIPFAVGVCNLLLWLPLTATSTSHVGLSLHAQRFRNSASTRSLWALRWVFFCNAATAGLQFAMNNMVVVASIPQTIGPQVGVLAFFFFSMFASMSRFMMMSSIEEPEMWLLRWIVMIVVDVLLVPLLLVPHAVLLCVEWLVAIAHAVARNSDRPYNLSGPARFYNAWLSFLFFATQAPATTATAGLEDDLKADLKQFPLVRTTAAGSAGFLLTLPELEDLRLRQAAEQRTSAKNQRTLQSVTVKLPNDDSRKLLGGAKADDPTSLTVQTSSHVELVVRSVPHSQDARHPLSAKLVNGVRLYFLSLFDFDDSDVYHQLAVPEVTLSFDRQFDVDLVSFAYIRDALLQLESEGRERLLQPGAKSGSPSGLGASPVLLTKRNTISPARLSFRSSSRASSRSNSRQSMKNRGSSFLDRTRSGRESAVGNPLSARESPAPYLPSTSKRTSVVLDVPLAAGEATHSSLSNTSRTASTVATPPTKSSTPVALDPFATKPSGRQRASSQRRADKDPAVSFADALQQYAAIPEQGSQAGLLSGNAPFLSPGLSNRSRASSVASSRGHTEGGASDVDMSDNEITARRKQSGRHDSGAMTSETFAKLLAERQATAPELKSPYLDPNEYVLRLPDTDEQVVDKTQQVASLVADIRRVSATLEQRVAKGTTDIDVAAIEALEKQLASMKHNLSVELTMMPKSLKLSSKVSTDQLLELIDMLVRSPEANNTSLLALILQRFGIGMKLGDVAFARGWCHFAVRDSKPRFLAYILQLPGVCEAASKKPSELLLLASKNEKCRLPLLQVLLRFAVPLGLNKRKAEFETFWNDVMDVAGSARKVNAIEDSAGRLALLYYLCTTPDIVRATHEKPRKDGLTVFSRACKDGDEAVVSMMLSKNLVTDVNERSAKEGLTPLMLATLGGHKPVVELLLKNSKVDVLLKCNEKTAYVAAQENFKNPLLVAMLRKAQQEAEAQWREPGAATSAARRPSFQQSSSKGLQRVNSINRAPEAVSEIAGSAVQPIATAVGTPPTLSLGGSFAGTPVNASPAVGLVPPVGDSLRPQELAEMFNSLNSMYTRADMGSDDAQVGVVLIRLRQEAAGRLARCGSASVPPGSVAAVTSVLDRLVEGGDGPAGAVELLRACALYLDPVTFNFKAVADEQEWQLTAARGGHSKVLGVVLAAGELSADTARDVIIASSKSEHRLELAKTLLESSRAWRRHRGSLAPLWQQFFENIGFTSTSNGESAGARFAVMDKMLKHRDIEILFEHEASDGYTLFARACAYGDAEFVQFMIERRVLSDPNRPLSDGTTPLMQAVAGNHCETVEVLLRFKAVDPTLTIPGVGTALDAAVKLKRQNRIVDALRSAMGMPSAHRVDTDANMKRRGSVRMLPS